MKTILFLMLAVFILIACVPKSEVDEANKKIAESQAQAAAAQVEIEKIKAEAKRLRAAAEAAENKKPALPVTVSFRKAIMGPGNVAVFNTTIKAPVAVLVHLHSAALGTTKQFELHLESNHATQLGHFEGAVIENGDRITIENQNYSPVSFTVSN
jgi:hypothetical protein